MLHFVLKVSGIRPGVEMTLPAVSRAPADAFLPQKSLMGTRSTKRLVRRPLTRRPGGKMPPAGKGPQAGKGRQTGKGPLAGKGANGKLRRPLKSPAMGKGNLVRRPFNRMTKTLGPSTRQRRPRGQRPSIGTVSLGLPSKGGVQKDIYELEFWTRKPHINNRKSYQADGPPLNKDPKANSEISVTEIINDKSKKPIQKEETLKEEINEQKKAPEYVTAYYIK
ncbi:uncharacterized protein LOC128677831 isoform X2 [Plodia interpunctella]|uniref:uncharacterized protein LOC128677831 isoform X2 n=1 Tax=Plodia interpunctella TaxID=58824 RepID=UPI002368D17C|nr:uncharacterized protein LOC128677831 isoform X2 [Plodia interpunctella]